MPAPFPASLMPTRPNAIVRDSRAYCYQCHVRPDGDDNTLMSVYHDDSLLLVCGDCRDNNYTYCEPEDCYASPARPVIDALGMSSEDYYSLGWLRSNCVYDSAVDEWFVNEEARNAYFGRQRGTVYRYHETNPISAHGWPSVTQQHELCFGVELEMEHKRNVDSTGQQELAMALGGRMGGLPDVAGNYILAADGSLNASGVELITCPYTLDYHQKQFGWDTLLAKVATIGRSGKNTQACGMHVHCNRAAISALTLGKMLVFANTPDNKLLLTHVAQRPDNRYTQRAPKRFVDGKVSTTQKYDALHVTQSTIEFRIFRGNLRPERVLKNIEFCHALITYCQQAGIKACLNHADFAVWLGKNRGNYKHLVAFLAPLFGYKLTRNDVTEDQ